MSDFDDDSSILKSKKISDSILEEDNDVVNELSELILSNINLNPEEKKNIQELNKKNEFSIAYKNKENLSIKTIKDSFDISKIKVTEDQLKSNLTEEKYDKFKSGQINNEDDIFLKIEDFPENPISEIFIYEEASDSINQMKKNFKKELEKLDLMEFKWNNISKGKRLEVLVEETYNFNSYEKEQMIEDLCFLKRVMYFWRAMAREGNCFYRSVIFSWLEYLIFNKKINILKIFMTNLYLKFDQSNTKLKNLPTQIKKQFLSSEKSIALTILEIIINFLSEDNIKDAYTTLIKAFNVTRVFDRVMIFYLRYLIYEFISDNQNKLFSKKFPIFLGNLLSEEYETIEGKFLYEKYYIDNLLKFFTCVDKLAIFIIPFILKVNLNIVFYHLGKDGGIESKFFSCDLPNKDKTLDTINLLYRKGHYDVFYSYDYYDKFDYLFKLYSVLEPGFREDYFILDQKDIYKQEKILNKISPYTDNESIILCRAELNKQKDKLKNKENMEKKINEENNNKFIKVINDGINNNNHDKKCFICQKEIQKDDKIEILPCSCKINFCSDDCKNYYYKCLCAFFKSMEFKINLKCGRCGKIINRIKFIENLNYQNEDVRKALKNKMLEFYKLYCMNCLNPVGEMGTTIRCKCPQLNKLLDTKKFDHNLCEKCIKINTGNCKICNIYHPRIMNNN